MLRKVGEGSAREGCSAFYLRRQVVRDTPVDGGRRLRGVVEKKSRNLRTKLREAVKTLMLEWESFDSLGGYTGDLLNASPVSTSRQALPGVLGC